VRQLPVSGRLTLPYSLFFIPYFLFLIPIGFSFTFLFMDKAITTHLNGMPQIRGTKFTRMKNILVIVMMLIAGCSSGAQSKTLPSTRPADLRFSYHYDGGMLYYSEDLTLSKDSCVFIKNDAGKKTIRRFMLSATEMDALFSMLVANKFDQIESKQETGVYDRGGISMDINWDAGKRSSHVSDAQMNFVNEKWRTEWQKVVEYITKLMQANNTNVSK